MANTNANTALSTNATLGAGPKKETYREIKCCFSVTIRRDAWGVPVAIMGQWIVSLAIVLSCPLMVDNDGGMGIS
jgi:hypothetical protein